MRLRIGLTYVMLFRVEIESDEDGREILLEVARPLYVVHEEPCGLKERCDSGAVVEKGSWVFSCVRVVVGSHDHYGVGLVAGGASHSYDVDALNLWVQNCYSLYARNKYFTRRDFKV